MALKIYANVSAVDAARNETGTEWIEIDTDNDYLIFTGGSDLVAEGESIPSTSDLNRAAMLLTGVEVEVTKYFLADVSENKLREIQLMGSSDSQHVLCFEFDAATLTEPVLEMWDDDGLNSIALEALGAGTPDNSWYTGICTTSASAGINWTGKTLAGSTSDHFIELNDGSGALSIATDLYAQLKVVIPSTATFSGTASPIIVIKYATN